jgi:hypothetical protein
MPAEAPYAIQQYFDKWKAALSERRDVEDWVDSMTPDELITLAEEIISVWALVLDEQRR